MRKIIAVSLKQPALGDESAPQPALIVGAAAEHTDGGGDAAPGAATATATEDEDGDAIILGAPESPTDKKIPNT